MNETRDIDRAIAAADLVADPLEDPWLEVVRRHEAFLARRREAAAVEAGAGPTGASLFWCHCAEEQDRAA